MLLDVQNLLSDQQDLAVAAGNHLSTNTIDLGATGTDFLGGTPVSDPGRSDADVLVQVTETFTSAGSATMQVQLVSADNAALSTSLTVLQETPAIPVAQLVAGYQFKVGKLPPGITQRYLGVRYVVGTAAMTAGQCTAGIVVDRQTAGL